nr:MAG TPA: hypothetical protein [Caudoviricetes sp.]
MKMKMNFQNYKGVHFHFFNYTSLLYLHIMYFPICYHYNNSLMRNIFHYLELALYELQYLL